MGTKFDDSSPKNERKGTGCEYPIPVELPDEGDIDPDAPIPQQVIDDLFTKIGTGRKKNQVSVRHIMILDLIVAGYRGNQIATALGIDSSSVSGVMESFKPFLFNLKYLGPYRNSKKDLLAAGQLALLRAALDPRKLQKASTAALIAAYDLLNRAERLENNQSTENVSHAHYGAINLAAQHVQFYPDGTPRILNDYKEID